MLREVKIRCKETGYGIIVQCDTLPAAELENEKLRKVVRVYEASCVVFKNGDCPLPNECVLAKGDRQDLYEIDDTDFY